MTDATVPLVGRTNKNLSRQLETSKIHTGCKCKGHIRHITFTTHLSFGLFLPQSIEPQGKATAYTSSTRVCKRMILPESSSPREKFPDPAKDRWFNHTFTSGASESKTSKTCAKHIDDCKGGARDWLTQIFELSNDFTLANDQIHPAAVFMPHQPMKVMRTTCDQLPQTGASITTRWWTYGPNQTWHRSLAFSWGGDFHKTNGTHQSDNIS